MLTRNISMNTGSNIPMNQPNPTDTTSTTSTAYSSKTLPGERKLDGATKEKVLDKIRGIDAGGIPDAALLELKKNILNASDDQRIELKQEIESVIPCDTSNKSDAPLSIGAMQLNDLNRFCLPCNCLEFLGIRTSTLAQMSAVLVISKLPEYLQNGILLNNALEDKGVGSAVDIIRRAWHEIENLEWASDRLKVASVFRASFLSGDIEKLFPAQEPKIQNELLIMFGLERMITSFFSLLKSSTDAPDKIKAYLEDKKSAHDYFLKDSRYIKFLHISDPKNQNIDDYKTISEIEDALDIVMFATKFSLFLEKPNHLYFLHKAIEFCNEYEKALMIPRFAPFNNPYMASDNLAQEDSLKIADIQEIKNEETINGNLLNSASDYITNRVSHHERANIFDCDVDAILADGTLKSISGLYDAISGNGLSVLQAINAFENALRHADM